MRNDERYEIQRAFDLLPHVVGSSWAVIWFRMKGIKTPTREEYREKTLEGKILQDADRLDALGAIGIARVFATGGSLKRPFYNIDDPFCKRRIPDDHTWTVDHFFQKLLKLESLMNTKSGKAEAKKRTRILREFLNQLKHEI